MSHTYGIVAIMSINADLNAAKNIRSLAWDRRWDTPSSDAPAS